MAARRGIPEVWAVLSDSAPWRMTMTPSAVWSVVSLMSCSQEMKVVLLATIRRRAFFAARRQGLPMVGGKPGVRKRFGLEAHSLLGPDEGRMIDRAFDRAHRERWV